MYMFDSNNQRVQVNSKSPSMGFPTNAGASENKSKDRHRMVWIIVAIVALLLLAIVLYMMKKRGHSRSSSPQMNFRQNPPSFGFTFY